MRVLPAFVTVAHDMLAVVRAETVAAAARVDEDETAVSPATFFEEERCAACRDPGGHAFGGATRTSSSRGRRG